MPHIIHINMAIRSTRPVCSQYINNSDNNPNGGNIIHVEIIQHQLKQDEFPSSHSVE
jgi:hypothetical protein